MLADPLDLDAYKRRLGPYGAWLGLAFVTGGEARAAAREVERLGFGSLWIPESPTGKEVLTLAAHVLDATERLIVGTGIATIWARDPVAAMCGAANLSEASDSRFILGLGVSHGPIVERRGHVYEKPLTAMRNYLDGMDASRYRGPLAERPPVVIAALRPKSLVLARDRTDGSHTYFVPAEHTRLARAVLGPAALLTPEIAVVLDENPDTARATAREYAKTYLALPNYANTLRDLGYSEDDLLDGGSDALIDAVIPWGTAASIAAGAAAHIEAGADHVSIQPIAETTSEKLTQLAAIRAAL